MGPFPLPKAPYWVSLLTILHPPHHIFVFTSFQSSQTLRGRPLSWDSLSCSSSNTWHSSKPSLLTSRGIKRSLPLTFTSPFFELMLCYRNLAIFLLLANFHSLIFSWDFGAISCPIFSHSWMNKESFGGHFGSLRLVLWSRSYEVILFLTHFVVLNASIPW